MKLRRLPRGKSLLAVGLLMGLTACEDDSTSGASGAKVSVMSPRPMLAQIGELPAGPVEKRVEAAPIDGIPAAPKEGAVAKAVPVPAAVVPKLSPGVEEVVQLAQAQVGDEVLLAYIENSPARFDLRAEVILHLHDLGLSAQVIAAMIRHDQNLPVTPWESPTNASAGSVAAAEAGGAEAEAEKAAGEAPPTVAAVSTGTAPATEPATVTHNYFYNSLAPYGTWVEVPDYGWCWRPTVAVIDSGWRPYVHGGRWVYSDCGWYWHSYYSWGWAPFHYGRWYMSGPYGWVWMPDTCWGPAWVTWRHCDGYYGWAPLPPGAVYGSGFGLTYYGGNVSVSFGFGFSSHYYTFVPVGHFYSHRPWAHCVPPGHVGPIYNNSTVINNYVQGDGNNTVINVGPGTGAVAAATRTEIQKVSIRDVESVERNVVRAEAMSRDGTTLNVYRPRLPDQAATPPAEITRRQQELQVRSHQLARSEAGQAAVVRAASTVNRSGTSNPSLAPRSISGPTTAPRSVGGGSGGSRNGSGTSREAVAQPQAVGGSPVTSTPAGRSGGSRVEPRRNSRGPEPMAEPVGVEPRQLRSTSSQSPAELGPTRQPVTRPAAPRSGWSSPSPRPEPARSVVATPSRQPVRSEPVRTVNPAYSVTPAPGSTVVPRSNAGVPAPSSPGLGAPRSGPVLQPSVPRSQPRTESRIAPRAVQPSAPVPAPVAPATVQSGSMRGGGPGPVVAPSRSSGAGTPGPSASPARPSSAPSSAPRSGSSRSR